MGLKITDVKITTSPDLSGNEFYSAKQGDIIIQFKTDGILNPHITKEEFITLVKSRKI